AEESSGVSLIGAVESDAAPCVESFDGAGSVATGSVTAGSVTAGSGVIVVDALVVGAVESVPAVVEVVSGATLELVALGSVGDAVSEAHPTITVRASPPALAVSAASAE